MHFKQDKNRIERDLANLSKLALSKKDLENARVRTWNALYEKLSVRDENKYEDTSERKSISRLLYYSLTFSLIITLIGGYYIYNTLVQDNLKTPPEATNASKFTESKENIKVAASNRFSELSKLKYEEYLAVLDNTTTPTPENGQNKLIDNTARLDDKKVENIIKDIQDTSINYSSIEIKLSNIENTDISIPGYLNLVIPTDKTNINYEVWTAINHSKTLIKSDDKIIAYELQNPNFQISFKGGSYAIKQNFKDTATSIGGISNTGNNIVSPEIPLMKYLIEKTPSEIKEIDKNTVSLSYNEEENKLDFYIDIRDFRLKRFELRKDSKLQLSINVLETKVINSKDLSKDFDGKELSEGNIEVKEFEANRPIQLLTTNELQSKYKILLEDEKAEYTFNYQDTKNISELELAKLSKDYDPSIKDIDIQKYTEVIYQSPKLHMKILSKDYAKFIPVSSPPRVPVTIKVNGEIVSLQLIPSEAKEKTISIFEFEDKFYIINSKESIQELFTAKKNVL